MRSDIIRINCTGDIMLGDQYLSLGFGVRSVYDGRYGALIPSPAIRTYLRDADLFIGNLESSFHDQEGTPTVAAALAANEGAIDFLKDIGLTHACLANNHALEYGPHSLHQLEETLGDRGIAVLGTARNAACHIGDGSAGVAVLAYTMVPDYKNTSDILLWQGEATLKEIEKTAKEARYTIVYVHWGNEFISTPSAEQVQIGRSMIRAGARAVIGCHPHVLQPIERFEGGIIAYSLGNFIFDSYSAATFPSIILRLVMDPSRNTIDYEYLPLQAEEDYSLRVASEPEALEIARILNAPVQTIDAGEYALLAQLIRNQYRTASVKHILGNLLRYHDKRGLSAWLTKRALLVLKNYRQERTDPSAVYKWH